MRNKDKWHESKYVIGNNEMEPSNEVGKGSWLITKLVADMYYEMIPKYAGGRLLDLGCGAVPLYKLYNPYVSDVICVDWDNSLHGNLFLDMNIDISDNLPFDDCSFQTIICSDVLEHIFEPINVLNEMVRVCDHNGHIIISSPFNYWMHECPYDYCRMTEFFYNKYVEMQGETEIIEIHKLGGKIAVLIDKYAKIGVNHKWMLPLVIQKMYYKYLLAKDKCDNDTLEVFLVLRKR